MRHIEISSSALSVCKIELGESRGLGQFGKGRSRRWYKRRLNKEIRRAGLRMIARETGERRF